MTSGAPPDSISNGRDATFVTADPLGEVAESAKQSLHQCAGRDH